MRVITLTTDFGTSDPYVAAVKGVILSQASDVGLVDITHEIPPQEIGVASQVLEDVVDYFPPQTVHLAVVDPGVGTDRFPIVVEWKDQFFVGPDNGVFSFVSAAPRCAFWKIHEDKISRAPSSTFHGRDIFAPAAAWIARGRKISEFCQPIAKIHRLKGPKVRMGKGFAKGEVVAVDHFGNLLTNLRRDSISSDSKVYVRGRRIGAVRRTYAEAKSAGLIALWSSVGRLEIAARDCSAQRLLTAKKGTPVTVRW